MLVEPEHVIPQVGARIMDLQDPGAKMSTSYGTEAGLIYIDDEPDDIARKLGRAETDSGREVVRAPDKPGISNLIEILAVTRGVAPEQIEREFEGKGYGDFKQAVAEDVVEHARARARALPGAAPGRGRRSSGRWPAAPSAPASSPQPVDGGGARRDGHRARPGAARV